MLTKQFYYSNIKRPRKVEVFSYPLFPVFRKSIAFWKVPMFRPFVFLVRAAVDEGECEGLVEWNRQEKKEILGEKSVPVLLCAAHISLGLIWDRTLALAVTGWPLTARATAQPI